MGSRKGGRGKRVEKGRSEKKKKIRKKKKKRKRRSWQGGDFRQRYLRKKGAKKKKKRKERDGRINLILRRYMNIYIY